MRKWLGIGLVVGLLVATYAASQTYTPPVASDYQSVLNTVGGVATSSAAISSNLPGYQGNAQSLQDMSGDSVAQLQSAGQASAATNPLSGIIQSNNSFEAANPIDPNSSFLQPGLAVQQNPTGTAGNTAGAGSQVCTSTPTTLTSHSTYTCETGNVVTNSTQTCTLEYTPVIKSDYIYSCHNDFVWGQSQLVPDSKCTTLAGQSACTMTAQTCTTPSAPETYNYSCYSGQSYTPATATCTTNTSESTWGYVCNETWVDGQSPLVPDSRCQALTGNGACTETGSVCTQAGVQQTDTYSTFVGTQYTPVSAQCTTNTLISQYNYQCEATWVDGQGQLVPSAACSALASSSTCTETASQCTSNGSQQSDTYSCFVGTSYAQNSGSCDITHTTSGTTPTQYTYNFNFDIGAYRATEWATVDGANQNIYLPYYYFCKNYLGGAQDDGCTYLSNHYQGIFSTHTFTGAQWNTFLSTHPIICTQVYGESAAAAGDPAPSSYFPNAGLYACNVSNISAPDVSFWKQADFSNLNELTAIVAAQCTNFNLGTYSTISSWGPGAVEANASFTCGSALSGYSATSTNGGYTDNGVNASACTSYSGNSACTLTNKSCNSYMDPTAAAYLGLPATTCADETDSYTCTTALPVNYCTGSAPSGGGWTDTTQTECSSTFNGSCAVQETDYNWTRETGVNNCLAETRNYTCSADVPPADPAVSIITSTDSSACQSIATNPGCTLAGTSCASMTTYTAAQLSAMGLSANYCAQTTNTYTCTSSSPVNYTTGGPPTGSGWSCTNTQQCNASGGQACAITETDYSCSRTTGINGCVTKQDTYSCSQDVPAADPAQNISMSTDSSQCQSLASNSQCSVTGTSCASMTTYSAAQLAQMGLSANYCAQTAYTYTCAGWTPVNYCSPMAPTGQGWNCTNSTKCNASGPNACAVTETDYSCSRTPGVNGCVEQTDTYDCSQDIPAADPYDQLIKTVTGGSFQYSPACQYATQKGCTSTGTVCTQNGSTQIVDGVSVTAACWQEQQTFSCDTVTGTSTDCAPGPTCTLQTQNCLDDTSTTMANCQTVQNVYDCTSTSAGAPTTTCTTSYTNGQQTLSTQDSTSNDFAEAMAAVNTASQGSTSYQSATDLKIFGGTNLDCKKGVFGLYNCCKDSGLLLGNLVSCTTDEKNLYAQQQQKSCHYIGTFCSNNTIFGCTEEKMSYCCYGSVLARIVEEAGHTQLNKAWGSAKSPDCSGFTVAEFQSLNLANVDFSDFYASKMSELDQNSPDSVVAQIKSSLSTMTTTGSSTNPNQ